MKLQRGSAHLVIIVGLVIMLIGALSFIAWQNFASKPQTSSNNTISDNGAVAPASSDKPEADAAITPKVEDGTIKGSLTYPSEGIPAELEIHAFNLDTNHDFYTKDHLKGSEYHYGVGYKLDVPAGRYYVYGLIPSRPEEKAYYDEFVKCGFEFDTCKDYSKIEVTVEAGKETEDIMVGDWYQP